MSNIKYAAALAAVAVGVGAILSFTETPGPVVNTTVHVGLLVILIVSAALVVAVGAVVCYVVRILDRGPAMVTYMGGRSDEQGCVSRQQKGGDHGDK